jgi:pantetheine-phosphate adenylyltransferase
MRALFPGTFDPFTNGHLDLAERAAKLFDRVVIAVAASPAKDPLFSVAERKEMISATLDALPGTESSAYEVTSFDGLVVDCARDEGTAVIVRGLRAVSDFEFEFQMALMNRRLNPSIETVFMMPAESYSYVSSRLVKEVFQLGGRVSDLVPAVVERRLCEVYGTQAGGPCPEEPTRR